jgi:predicted nucleotidyltransferase
MLPPAAERWAKARTFHHSLYPAARIAAEREQSVSVCLPARECVTSCLEYFAYAYYIRRMDYRRPLLLITPTLDGDVLAALARADVEFSGRELARHVRHGSPEGIRRAADRLVEQGTLLRRSAGPAHLYRLNRDHLAAPWIEGLASLRQQLIERLRALLDGWDQPAKVALLFGSVARNEASADSDLDLFVVRPSVCEPDSEPWRDQLLELHGAATAWTGNDARVLEYGEHELIEAAGQPLLEAVLRDGIELFGSRRTLRRLIRLESGA